ncbi:MAG: PcfJ domain-containing protein [Clostridium sp.]|jgi:DNA-directed RNA polymerase subunit RPC12/RpoP|nr:PcfJ domain-containing protein [Clostridium sp.]
MATDWKKRAAELQAKVFPRIPPLPDYWEEELLNGTLQSSRYLFYSRDKQGRWGYCSHCGNIVELGKRHDSIHNQAGECPDCKTQVMYKALGRGRKELYDTGYQLILQPLLPDPDKPDEPVPVIVRSFWCWRDYNTLDWTGDSIVSFPETEWHERERIYFAPGRTQKWKRYAPNNPRESFTGLSTEWRAIKSWKHEPSPKFGVDCLPAHFSRICGYTDFCDEVLRNTALRYANLAGYSNYNSGNDMYCEWLRFYCKYSTAAEKLVKEGFGYLAAKMSYGSVYAELLTWPALRRNSVPEILGMPRGLVRWVSGQPDEHGYYDYNLTRHKIAKLMADNGNYGTELAEDLIHITLPNSALFWALRAVYDRVAAYAAAKGKSKETVLPAIVRYVKAQTSKGVDGALQIWHDYLSQCAELHRDMSDKRIIMPSELAAAHERATDLINERDARANIKKYKEMERSFRAEILPELKKLRRESSGLIIRPATGAKELHLEGALLNHCVGSYTAKHLNGDTAIMLVRRKGQASKPYFTVEWKAGQVLQCRGDRNCAPPPELKAFVDEWAAWARKRQKSATRKRSA